LSSAAALTEEVRERARAVGMRDCVLKNDRPGLLNSVAQCLLESKRGKAAL
jgi:hypothetical protein